MKYFVFVDDLHITRKEVFIRFDGFNMVDGKLCGSPVVIEATLSAEDFEQLTHLNGKHKRTLREKWCTLDVEEDKGYAANLYTSVADTTYIGVKISNLERVKDKQLLARLSFPF